MSIVLITGGAGFIGHRVQRELELSGHTVLVVDMVRGDLELDLTDNNAVNWLSKFAADNHVDVFCHLAALVGGGKFLADREYLICTHNIEVDMNVLDAFLKCRVADRFVYCSSSMVYQNGLKEAIESQITDDVIPPPTNNYGFSKLQGERLVKMMCKEHCREWVIGRPFNVYGPGETAEEEVGYAHVIPDFHRKLRDSPGKLEVHGDGLQTRSFTHADDVARAFAMLCTYEAAAYESFNVASTENITMNDLGVMMGRMMGGVIPELSHTDPWPGDTKQRVPNTDKIKKILGWQPMMPFIEGLRRNIEWLDE